MTTDDRDFWRATTDWLEAGSDRTPPDAVEGVLLAIRTTRQERVLRSPWRPISMNTLGKALIAATAVVAIAFAWINFGPTNKNSVGTSPVPTPTPSAAPEGTPSASPTATPTAAASPSPSIMTSSDLASLAPGRYTFATRVPNPAISFSVPSGWDANQLLVGRGATAVDGPGAAGAWMLDYPFDHGFKNPCTDHTPVVPAAGSGPIGLLNVIAHQPGIRPGPITDVTVGGIPGKAIDYTVTADPTTCGNGVDAFWIWGTCPAPATVGCEMIGTGDRRYGVVKGAHERAYAIPVGGKIYTFATSQPAGLSAADRLQLQQFLDSIVFESPA